MELNKFPGHMHCVFTCRCDALSKARQFVGPDEELSWSVPSMLLYFHNEALPPSVPIW